MGGIPPWFMPIPTPPMAMAVVAVDWAPIGMEPMDAPAAICW